MTDPIVLADHAGVRLTHGKPTVNGVEIHYAIGGTGEPVFLLHGVPKTMSYWRHVVPLLTPHYTVVAVDNRGFGGSQRPPAGYDTATMAGDIAGLATHLGFDRFRVAGEDWGAAIAYAVAAFHRPRVQQLVFQETLLAGLPNRPHYADPISCPVLAVGAQAYLGDQVSRQLAQVASDVRGAVITESGHNIALENPAALARAYLDFFAGR
jgi:pimeloyl-ACP methyl ester carboxylesterase